MSCNCVACQSKHKRKRDLKMSDRANKWITVRGRRVKLDGDGKIPPGTFDRGKSSSKKSTRLSLKEEVTQAQALGKKMAKDGKSKDDVRKALIKLEKRNGHAGSKPSKARAAGMAEFRAHSNSNPTTGSKATIKRNLKIVHDVFGKPSANRPGGKSNAVPKIKLPNGALSSDFKIGALISKKRKVAKFQVRLPDGKRTFATTRSGLLWQIEKRK